MSIKSSSVKARLEVKGKPNRYGEYTWTPEDIVDVTLSTNSVSCVADGQVYVKYIDCGLLYKHQLQEGKTYRLVTLAEEDDIDSSDKVYTISYFINGDRWTQIQLERVCMNNGSN